MSNIKDSQSAKQGLSSLFGGSSLQESTLPKIEDSPKSKEEIIETLSEETKEALQKEVQRRQYLKAGRPRKGEEGKGSNSTRMTFIIDPEKQERLREIALQEGLFIKEILEKGIDLIIAKYEKEGKI